MTKKGMILEAMANAPPGASNGQIRQAVKEFHGVKVSETYVSETRKRYPAVPGSKCQPDAPPANGRVSSNGSHATPAHAEEEVLDEAPEGFDVVMMEHFTLHNTIDYVAHRLGGYHQLALYCKWVAENPPLPEVPVVAARMFTEVNRDSVEAFLGALSDEDKAEFALQVEALTADGRVSGSGSHATPAHAEEEVLDEAPEGFDVVMMEHFTLHNTIDYVAHRLGGYHQLALYCKWVAENPPLPEVPVVAARMFTEVNRDSVEAFLGALSDEDKAEFALQVEALTADADE